MKSDFILWFLTMVNFKFGNPQPQIFSTDDLENHISPDDLKEFLALRTVNASSSTTAPSDVDYAAFNEPVSPLPVPRAVDCFGLGELRKKLWFLDMRPGSSNKVDTHFFFSSRLKPQRVQVHAGNQFGLEWVDFDPTRRTIMIVHGFMSHSNASWVHDMTRGFLNKDDLNVIAVDWSKGGNTWKYWRAVANTRRVGSDVTGFMRQLISKTGANIKDFHFVGHSLGAHIAAYVSYHLGRVARVTGLDPAQPCFSNATSVERLDQSDADFVDIIHTNGRLLEKLGFGLPEPIGDADFYPNGGMQQPGCTNYTNSIWVQLFPKISKEVAHAICSHGRSYLLFTESLLSTNCSFRSYRWNLTYEGVNASLVAACDQHGSCSEMGINAIGTHQQRMAKGTYFVLTTEKEPYCPNEWERRHPDPELLRDLRQGFRIDRSIKNVTNVTEPYADPLQSDDVTTTQSSWLQKLLRYG